MNGTNMKTHKIFINKFRLSAKNFIFRDSDCQIQTYLDPVKQNDII